MPATGQTIIVTPCYNEEPRLPVDAFRRFFGAAPAAHILFVDDGSTDDTRRLLLELTREYGPHCSAAALAVNSGKAEAVRQGLRLALRHGASAVGYWDADLATPLEEIADFQYILRRRPDVDVVLGVRMSLAGRRVRRKGLRAVLGAGCRWAASGVLRTRLKDTQCGAKLFRATARLDRALAWPFSSRWLFDVELLLRLQRLSGGVSPKLEGRFGETPRPAAPCGAWFEQPLHQWSECGGSKVRPRDYARGLADLAKLYGAYRTIEATAKTEAAGLRQPLVADAEFELPPASAPLRKAA